MVNGSDEILNFAFLAFGDAEHGFVCPDISYGFYPVFAALNHVPLREIPLGEGKAPIRAGTTMTEELVSRIIEARVPHLTLRAASPQSEEVPLLTRVSYVRAPHRSSRPLRSLLARPSAARSITSWA